MRILFYLPVVTPWWFDNVVLPLIQVMAKDAEIHVLVPLIWKNTGVTPDQLRSASTAEHVRWHIVDDPDHPTLRTRPADPQGVIDFVRGIDPDYTFCRSADARTPSAFPGEVRYLMESGAPPFPGVNRKFVLQKNLLQHGEMPTLKALEREQIDNAFADVWTRFAHRFSTKKPFSTPRENALARMGIDPGRRVVALPLEYAHEENFFSIHEKHSNSLELIEHIAGSLDDETVLAVTDHPLNYLYCDNSAVYRALRELGPRAHLVTNEAGTSEATDLLAKYCDGFIVSNSKSVYSAAYFMKPVLRLTNRSSAAWLNSSDDTALYFDQLRHGTAPVPSGADVRTWFGMRLLHDIIDPLETSTGDLIDRVEQPFDAARMAMGLDRFEEIEREHLATVERCIVQAQQYLRRSLGV